MEYSEHGRQRVDGAVDFLSRYTAPDFEPQTVSAIYRPGIDFVEFEEVGLGREGPWLPSPLEAASEAPDSGSAGNGTAKLEPGDLAFNAKMRILAAAASAFYPNASGTLFHYLEGSGDPYEIDVDKFLKVPEISKYFDREVRRGLGESLYSYIDAGMPISMSTVNSSDWDPVGVPGGDWHYAIGDVGASVVTRADFSRSGDIVTILVTKRFDISNSYDWDSGKHAILRYEKFGILIFDEVITDVQMGRLEQVGIAKRFDIYGSSTPRTETWTYDTRSETLRRRGK